MLSCYIIPYTADPLTGMPSATKQIIKLDKPEDALQVFNENFRNAYQHSTIDYRVIGYSVIENKINLTGFESV